MKYTLTLFCLFLAFNLNAQDCQWHLTRDMDRGYRIEFPKAPKKQNQDVPTALGDLVMEFYMLDNSASADAKNMVYMTAFTEYPQGTSDYNDEALQNSMLDGSVNGAANNVNGKIISQEKIKFNGYNGRSAKISIYEDAYIINLKNVLVGNKLYFMQVISTKEADDNDDMKRFFSSFDLIKMN